MKTIPWKEFYTPEEFLPLTNDWVMAEMDRGYGWALGKIADKRFHVARLSNYQIEHLYIPYYPCTGLAFLKWRFAKEEEIHPHANDAYWIRMSGKP